MLVLVVNAGSSSLKLRLLDDGDDVVRSKDLGVPAAGLDPEAVADSVRDWPAPDAVGHRVVHGGADFTGPVRLDASVRTRLDELTDLAPLHQPKSLAALDAVSAVYPGVPAVACFDTAFHARLPEAAARYAVPAEWHRRYGVRRYGFHGLSHAYSAHRAAQWCGGADGLRLVTCHLGAGASLAAVIDGRSVDTTMGFTPLEGLVMATRSGSVDPGLVLWLTEHERLRPAEVADALEHRSGLLALTGTADMREAQQRAAEGDAAAGLGVAVYVHRLVTGIGAMAAAAGGMDALVFTGGVGEHDAALRSRAAQRLRHLGAGVDEEGNTLAKPDAEITAPDARVRTFVFAAREDLQIAGEVRRLLR